MQQRSLTTPTLLIHLKLNARVFHSQTPDNVLLNKTPHYTVTAWAVENDQYYGFVESGVPYRVYRADVEVINSEKELSQ